MVNKISKRKNNYLKHVIKKTHKKKLKGGGIGWTKFKSLISKSPITPIKSKRRFFAKTKFFDNTLKKTVTKKFFRSDRGKSLIPFRSYRSTSQMKKNLEFGKAELGHHKREYILLDNKLNNYKAKFKVKYESEMQEFQKKFQNKLKSQKYNVKGGKEQLIEKYKKKITDFKKSQENFNLKHKYLADKVRNKKKIFQKASEKYAKRIERFEKKIGKKIKTSQALVSTGARRTCKKVVSQIGCQDAIKDCINQGSKENIVSCMNNKGFIDFLKGNLEDNMMKTKNIFMKRKLRKQTMGADKKLNYGKTRDSLKTTIKDDKTMLIPYTQKYNVNTIHSSSLTGIAMDKQLGLTKPINETQKIKKELIELTELGKVSKEFKKLPRKALNPINNEAIRTSQTRITPTSQWVLNNKTWKKKLSQEKVPNLRHHPTGAS